MPLGLFPEENAQALDTLYRGSPMGPPQPHWYSGIGTGAASGVGEGAIKSVEPLAPALDSSTSLLGALSPTDPTFDEPPKPISPQFREDPREAASNLTRQFAADPATTGWVGQILHNVASLGSRFVAGTVAGGGNPLVGAAFAGGTEAYSRYQASILEMDENTAKQLAAADGLLSGAGMLLPVGVGGGTAIKMLSGATINLAAGAGSRALTHTILQNAGYPAQAEQYKVLDAQSLASDAVLGLAFGWLARNHEPQNVPQRAVDAAHVAEDSAHVETGLFGDIPVNAQSRNDHMQNVIDATRAELNGEPVSNLRPVETIPNPAQEAAREAGAKGLSNAVDEAHDELVGTPVEPTGEPEIEAFHGTLLPFGDEYRPGASMGPHFGTLEQAEKFAEGEGGNIRPVALNFRNMLRLPDGGWENAPALALKLAKEGIITDAKMMELVPFRGRGLNPDENRAGLDAIKEELIRQGYDSVVYKNHSEGEGDSYISLKPETQVRSKFAEVPTSKLSRSARAEEAAKAEAEKTAQTAAQDPELADALAQVRDIAQRNPGKLFKNPETGDLSEPADSMKAAMEGMQDAEGEGKLGEIAAACFGRG